MNILKATGIGVSCINDASQVPGSNSRYVQKSEVATIVTTNGTEATISLHSTNLNGCPTIVSHSLPERGPNTEYDARENVLEHRYCKKCRVLGVFDVGLIFVQDGWNVPVNRRQL